MSYFRTEEEFWAALKRLNAFTAAAEWEPTTARKDHTDEFGVKVEEGEVYFTKGNPGSVSARAKLSRSSMEKLLYLTIELEPLLAELADRLSDKKLRGKVAVKALEGEPPA